MTLDIPQTALPRFAARLDAAAERLDADGIAVRRWGDGPPMVLLHGNHGSWLHWARCVPLLSGERSLYLIDMPGFGESADAEFGDGFFDYAAPIARLIAALIPAGPVTLGGFSLGSIVALHAYPALKDRVDRVIQVGAPSLTDGLDSSRGEMRRWRDLPTVEERNAAHAHNLGQMMLHSPGAIDAETVALQSINTGSARLRINRESHGNRAHRIIREERPRITAVWGEHDRMVSNRFPSAQARLDGLANGSVMHVIPGAAHWVQHEKPDEVARLILRD